MYLVFLDQEHGLRCRPECLRLDLLPVERRGDGAEDANHHALVGRSSLMQKKGRLAGGGRPKEQGNATRQESRRNRSIRGPVLGL